MANENLEFGININISGNYQQAANQVDAAFSKAGQSVNGFNDSLKKSSQAADQSLGGLLAIQSSLFVITHLAAQTSQAAFGFVGRIGQAFIGAVQSSAELEKSFATLKFVFKDSFALAESSIKELAARTPETTQTLADLAARLASVGVSANDLFKPLRGNKQSGLQNVAAGLTRLTGQDRVRAINSIGNALQDINSFTRLFNVGITSQEKASFQALGSEVEKTRFILTLFEKKFGGIFGPEGLAGSLLFNVQIAFGELQTLIQEAFTPAIEVLAPVFKEIGAAVTSLRNDKKFVEAIGQAFRGLGQIAAVVVKGLFLLVKVVTSFITTFPRLTTGIVIFGTLASIIVGLLASLAVAIGTILLLDLSIAKLSATTLIASRLQVLFTGALRFMSGGALGAAGSVSLLTAAVGLLFSPLLAIFAAITAASFVPKFFDLWATALGKVAQVLIVIASLISGILLGFAGLALGPVGAIAGFITGFSGTFAALTAAAPTQAPATRGVNATGFAQPRSQEEFVLPNNGQSNAGLQQSLDKLSSSIDQQAININNTVLLDGQVVAGSVNKVNKTKQDRYPSQ